MSNDLKLAIAEAAQAQELAQSAAFELHKKLIKENTLAADLFMDVLSRSAALVNMFNLMQSSAS